MLYINRFSKLFPSFKRGCYLFSNENNEGPKQKPKEVKQEDILKELAEKQIKLKSHKIQLKDIILRNYQVPQFPRKYHKLSVFLAEKKKRFFGITQKQMKEIIQYLEYKKRQRYEKQFRNYNSKQEGRQRAFGRIYSSPILRLPTYHHLIIAFMKLPQYEKWYNNNFHLFKSINSIEGLSQTKIQPQEQTNQSKLISQSESESESQQRQYEEQSLLEQDTDIYKQFPWPPQQAVELSGQQIFQMLEKSHPLARFMACQVYDLIHDRYAQKNKTFRYHTIRLPIIWFKHAYQFYLVEQSKEGMLQTKVEKYKQDYENLSKQQQLKYQSLAQHQVLKYNYYLKKISNRMRVSISKVKIIQKHQYNPYLQRTLLNMTKHSKSY